MFLLWEELFLDGGNMKYVALCIGCLCCKEETQVIGIFDKYEKAQSAVDTYYQLMVVEKTNDYHYKYEIVEIYDQ